MKKGEDDVGMTRERGMKKRISKFA